MPDCYLCGAYISRGAGYRRNVQVDSSTRIYTGRHTGSSYGTRSALRTLCRVCALIHDKAASGAWYRWPLHTLGFSICAYAGWHITMASHGLYIITGLIFLFGLPAIAVSQILESVRRGLIAEEVRANDDQARQMHAAERSDRLAMDAANISVLSSKAGISGRRPAPRSESDDMFREDDTIVGWAHRTAAWVSASANIEFAGIRDQLIDLAKFTKPRVGEGAQQFVRRAGAVVSHAQTALADDDAFAIRRPGEPPRAWLERTVPVFLKFDDGMSVDDILPMLIGMAEEHCPPDEDADCAEWTRRAMATLLAADEHHIQVGR